MNDIKQSIILLEKQISKLPENYYGGSYTDKEWIKNSELENNITLPIAYKWFIEKYSYLKLGGDMLKSIAPPDFKEDNDDDIFTYNYGNDENILIFLTNDDLESFYFKVDSGKALEQVYFRDVKFDIDELYSNNFIEFLLKEIPKEYFP